MKRRCPVLLVLGLVLLGPVPPWALGQEEEGYRLSLAEALRVALENNLDLVLSRKDPEISARNVERAEAAFDPQLTGGGSYAESVSEVFNPFDLNESKSLAANTGVSQQLAFGADYSARLTASRFNASGPLFSIESAYSSGLDLSFTLPLLRGLGKEVTTESLLIAKGNLEVSREELRRDSHATLEAVESAYWELVAARRALGVARQSLQRAEDLLELNRRKVEVGTLAPIEITQAQAGVASQEEGVIVAEANLENAEDELRRLLAIPEGDPLWEQRVVPTDEPSLERRPVDLDGAISRALEARPELAGARQDLRNRQLNERTARKALRSELNFEANVTPQGNNFEQNPVPGGDPIVSGRLAEAFEEIPEFENYDWSVALQYAIPLGNRAAKASHAIAAINREKAEIGLRNLEQTVRVEVRAAVRAVESGFKRVEAARANVELQRKKLEAEEQKFANGMSTSFNVLTFQNDLSEAELSEIRALIDYKKARVALERAQGTLLEAHGLRLETP